MKRLTCHVLLTEREYDFLKHGLKEVPTEQLMTKTAAKSGVRALLRKEGFICYHDRRPIPDSDEVCCSACPVMVSLGADCGERLCQRQKYWSK